MTNKELYCWQLPVKDDFITNELVIPKNAKIHCFDNNGLSLCKKHTQNVKDFDNIEQSYIVEAFTCKICWNKSQKLKV